MGLDNDPGPLCNLQYSATTSAYGPFRLGGDFLTFTVLFYVDATGRKRGRRMSVAGFFKSKSFPKRIVWHPSSRLDMRLWILNTLVFASASAGARDRKPAVARRDGRLRHGMGTAVSGPHAPSVWPLWTILTIATLLELLAYEFGYWISHYLFHAIPALWEFHKVHHSAEVLTTFTEMRTHPVEIVFFMNVIGLCTGLVFGAMTHSVRSRRPPFSLCL